MVMLGDTGWLAHTAICTKSAAVCLLNCPALHPTATEVDGNQLHPEQNCAIQASQEATKLVKASGCAGTWTKLTASMFPDLSFQVISFSHVLGALIASWDELRLFFSEFPVVVGTRAGVMLSFFSVLPMVFYQAFAGLAASLNLADVC